MILGIVPARSGSKSVPGKNIKKLAGKPLIAYTIEKAIGSETFDRIIVSTDSLEIANIAESCGAEVPFLRPSELAQDNTPGIDPILHALQWLDKEENYKPHLVMVLQPTSPLRSIYDIQESIKLTVKKQAETVVSVSLAKQHPYWMKTISEDGLLANFISLDKQYNRRQDLPPVYALNGAIYLAKTDVLLQQKTFYVEKIYGYVMPPERSLDIDSLWDFELAKILLKNESK